MIGGVYQISDNQGRCYIGSSKNLNKRHKEHWNKLRAGNHHSMFMQNCWNKHGETAFSFVVLEIVDDPVNLISREQYWLDLSKPVFNGSPTAKNTLGSKRTPEERERMSLSHKGHPSHRKPKSEEWKKQMSALHKGRPSPLKGRTMSLETRAKISAAKTGKKLKPLSEEAKAKLSAILTGRPKSELMKLRLSQTNKGRTVSEEARQKISGTLTGRTMPEETRQKISTTLKNRHKMSKNGSV